jgi:predicted NUDIX family NTP pyrophosphohydrolase
MPTISAGLLMYRRRAGGVEVLLVHPGGPFWRNKDAGAWTIPKGEPAVGEELLEAAKREFEEETGVAPVGDCAPLPPLKQKGGKVIHAWAIEGDLDPAQIRSNTFEMEWPPRSGRRAAFPEIDRAGFFSLDQARLKMNSGQVALLDALAAL